MENQRRVLGKLKSGEEIIDRKNSHYDKELSPILQEVFDKIESQDRIFFAQEVSFDKNVGNKAVVEVSEEDDIIYARRVGREGYSKFVRGKAPEETNIVSIVLLKNRDKAAEYILITGYFGPIAEVEPWDKQATEKSDLYWENHAFVFGNKEIVRNTETKEYPW